MDITTLYFGYGSNLDEADWARWCEEKGYEMPTLTPVEAAWLPGHSLRFHYRSIKRKGGAADVVPDQPGTAVPGMLFSLDEQAWHLVDEKEGHPNHYKRCHVTVLTTKGEVVEAITYRVVPEKRQPQLIPPAPGYRSIVQRGLEHYKLPIEHLKKSIEIFEANSTLDHVFVYGTLMEGEQRWPQLRPWSSGAQPGSIRGGLHHLGAYPGLRLDEEGVVHGELHRCGELSDALAVLDRIEGCDEGDPESGLYVRVPVEVHVESGSVWAWTYAINQLPATARRLHEGRWVACLLYTSDAADD